MASEEKPKKIKMDIDMIQGVDVDLVTYLSVCKGKKKDEFGVGIHGYVVSRELKDVKSSDKPVKFIISPIGYIDQDVKALYKEEDATPVFPSFYYNVLKTVKATTQLELYKELFSILSTQLLPDINNQLKEEYVKFGVPWEPGPFVVDRFSLYLNSTNVANNFKESNELQLQMVLNINQEQVHEFNAVRSNIMLGKTKTIIEETMNARSNIGALLADSLASYSSKHSTKNELHMYFRERTRFWTLKDRIHPLISYRQLFFTNESDTDHYISIMEYPTNVSIGKKSPEAAFGVVMMNEIHPVIKEAIDTYKSRTKPLSVLATINLANLMDIENIRSSWCMGTDRYDLDVHAVMKTQSKKDVIYPVVPTGLATKVYDSMSVLHNILDVYLNDKPSKILKFIDITNQFYNLEEKGTPTKITQSVSDVFIQVTEYDKTFKVPLELSKDCPTRNNFKALEKEHPKVTLVLQKDDKSTIVYYYTIVQCDSGVGIYCNFYSGKVIL